MTMRADEEVPCAQVLELLVASRLVSPGSEFRLHRQGFDQSAMGDLLGTRIAVAEKDRLYRCLDRILKHKTALFEHLRQRGQEVFQARFDVLLYDLTSTYLEGEGEEIPKAQHGYSRDHRFDCRQVVIALVVTPEGFPPAYEVMEGNTSDRTTLRGFLAKIEAQYGRARRAWLMDRGIPTEEVLQEMRAPEREAFYWVGTPRGKIQQYEKKWLELPWQKVREAELCDGHYLLPADYPARLLGQSGAGSWRPPQNAEESKAAQAGEADLPAVDEAVAGWRRLAISESRLVGKPLDPPLDQEEPIGRRLSR